MFLMPQNKWARLLAYVTGLVNQKLLLQNEYLAAENRILRAHLPTRVRLSDPARSTLAEIGKRLGRTALQSLTDLSEGRSRGIGKAHTGGKVGSKDAILGCEVLILEQEFLIDQPGDVGQQPGPFVL